MRVKLYQVEFMQYTNAMKNTVSNMKDIGEEKFIKVGNEPFLVKEYELDFYNQYGNGFRSIKFVGFIIEDKPKSADELELNKQGIHVNKNSSISAVITDRY